MVLCFPLLTGFNMRYVLCALVVPLLVACDQKSSAEHPQASTKAEKTEARVVPPAPPPAAKAVADKQATTAATKPRPTAPHPPPVGEPAEHTALDLSLPDEVLEELNANDTTLVEVPAPLLPPMFVDKIPGQPPLQLSGRLITGEGRDDSVEGAEVQFEFKR